MLTDQEIYARLGEDGFTRIVRAFYARVPADPVLGPKYERSLAARGDDMADAEVRLRDFLIGRFGGPQRYVEQHGPPRLRQRHVRFVIDEGAAEHWISVMDAAMADAGIDADVAEALRPYFRQTALHMVNR
ncbi:MAG TPA: globin [Phycisphaerales bacterium]|nr:globin [Phycisphaerales bacterium]